VRRTYRIWFAGMMSVLSASCLTGCRSEKQAAPVQVMSELDVDAVPHYVKKGMTEDEVQRALGKPHNNDGYSSTFRGVTDTFGTYTYWNPRQGYRVALVSFHNGICQNVEVKNYPSWAVLPFFSGGSTPTEIRKTFGSPSRIVPSKRSPGTVYWVYTDSKACHRTFLIGFDKGRTKTATLGPNREDWDSGRID
jgi:hypothetical protein